MYGVLVQGIIVLISALLNGSYVRFVGFLDACRPLLLFLIFVVGAYVGSFSIQIVRRALLVACGVILIGQGLVVSAQLAGLRVFSLIYSEEKLAGLDSTFRVVGTMSNPNAFAWLVCSISLLFFAMRRGLLGWLVLTFGMLLILLSGSRSILLLFLPVIIAFVFLSNHFQDRKLNWSKVAIVVGLLFGVGVSVLFYFRDSFLYLWELRELFATRSLGTIGSFAKRFILWEVVTEYFVTREAQWKWFIGLGPREELRTLDNDYLFVFFKYGAIGLVTHFFVLFTLGLTFLKSRFTDLGMYGFVLLGMAIVMGLQSETMAGWLHPLLIFYFSGICVGVGRREGEQG
jgi:hypothetical protein